MFIEHILSLTERFWKQFIILHKAIFCIDVVKFSHKTNVERKAPQSAMDVNNRLVLKMPRFFPECIYRRVKSVAVSQLPIFLFNRFFLLLEFCTRRRQANQEQAKQALSAVLIIHLAPR